MRDKLQAHLSEFPKDAHAYEVFKKIRKTIDTVRRQLYSSEGRRKSQGSQVARQNRAASRTMVMNLGRHDKNPDAWHTTESVRVRFFSKVLANTLALTPAAMHLLYMAEVLNRTIPPGGFDPPRTNETDTMWGNNTTIGMEPQIQEALMWTMSFGVTLIGGFNMRPFLAPVFEHLSEVVLHAHQGISSYFGDAAGDADAAAKPSSVVILDPKESEESVESDESEDDPKGKGHQDD